MRKENHSLWKVKHLMTMLSGDFKFAPCGQMVGANDLALFSDDYVMPNLHHAGRTSTVAGDLEERSPVTLNGESKLDHIEVTNGDIRSADGPQDSSAEQGNEDPDVTMEDPELAVTPTTGPAKRKDPNANNEVDKGKAQTNNGPQKEGPEKPSQTGSDSSKTADEAQVEDGVEKHKTSKPNGKTKHADRMDGVIEEDVNMEQSLIPTTETETDLAERNGVVKSSSLTSEIIDERFIHPFFTPPSAARPDRDAGLPPHEAEDIRRLLSLYVQKQEEVCRGTKRLYDGLLKADRLRKMVLGWAKSEGHCGPNRDMSDGEDWYDKEEWGLVDDLKKGQDEEEEETGVSAKKTRNRR
jgi:hypothetical protein